MNDWQERDSGQGEGLVTYFQQSSRFIPKIFSDSEVGRCLQRNSLLDFEIFLDNKTIVLKEEGILQQLNSMYLKRGKQSHNNENSSCFPQRSDTQVRLAEETKFVFYR